ncbi:MAG: EamA family transporter [Leucobacter sp.]
MTTRHRPPATALAVTAIFCVQFGNAFAGSFFAELGPLGASALRLGLSAVIIALIVRPRVRSWSGRTWLAAVLLGCGLGGMNMMIYLAIDRIPIGIAVTIELLGPLTVAAAGSRRVVDALWVLIAVGGVALLGIEPGHALDPEGMLLAGGAAVCWALYILASSRLGPRVRGIDGITVAIAVAAIVVVPFGAVDAVAGIVISPVLLLIFLGVAVFTSIVPYTLEFMALKSMSSRVFGVLSSLGPAVAALAGLIVLQQVLSLMQVLAIALVVVASVGVVATSRPRASTI